MTYEGVLRQVSRYLDEQNWYFFIDTGTPTDVASTLVEEYHHCHLNDSITIGGYRPDIIGRSPHRSIFAVEIATDAAMQTGIGQAAHNRQGVHSSYIAAPEAALEDFRGTALSCGLGLIVVSSTDSVSVEHPVTNVERTRRTLDVETAMLSSGGVSFPSTTRPENALLPVITIAAEGNTGMDGNDNKLVLPEKEVRTRIEDHDVTYNQPGSAISLATSLRLLRKRSDGSSPELVLTDTGRTVFRVLTGVVESQWESSLYEYVESLKDKRFMYKHAPELATVLRDRYLAVPDVRSLFQVLVSRGETRAELSQILSEVALSSPGGFMNVFCHNNETDQFKTLVTGSSLSTDDREFRRNIIEVTSPNALYNFLYQLRHVELLTDGTQPVHQNDDIEIGEYYWEWDLELLREHGVQQY